jgi:hypothetical protein
MALRQDRLASMIEALVGLVEQTDMTSVFPAVIRPALPIIKAVTRVDLPAELRARLLGSLRSIPARAAADPAGAERVARHAVHLVAWLTDQTDQAPTIEVGTFSLTSSPATESPSSAPAAPASQPSPSG